MLLRHGDVNDILIFTSLRLAYGNYEFVVKRSTLRCIDLMKKKSFWSINLTKF